MKNLLFVGKGNIAISRVGEEENTRENEDSEAKGQSDIQAWVPSERQR